MLIANKKTLRVRWQVFKPPPDKECNHEQKSSIHKTSVVGILKDLCKWKGVEIIEGNARIDHTHLLVS